MSTYRILRFFQKDHPRETVEVGVSLAEAQAHCRGPESSSRTAKGPEALTRTEEFGPWFDGYQEE